MPGYEPFLLCDFHVHTRWSDGRLSIREVVDLYGQTGRFDVIAITDHILMKRDLLGRVGRLATLGLKDFSVTEDRFEAYLADVIRPIKPFLTNYREIERRLMTAVAQRFCLEPSQPAIVTDLDNRILNDERQQLMATPPRPWGGASEPIGVTVQCWTPARAEREFLDRFERMMSGVPLS